MKAKGAIGFALVACAGLAIAYWVGYRAGGAAPSEPSRASQTERSNAASAESKPTAPRGKAPSTATGSEEAKRSLGDLESLFSGSKERIRGKEWEKIMDSLGAPDFPALLAAAE